MLASFICALVAASCNSPPQNAGGDAASPPPSAPPIDEQTVKTMSHALLDAADRDDEDAFTRTTGATFGVFVDQQMHPRAEVLTWFRQRKDHGVAPRTRTYLKEHVSIDGNSAIFVGEAVIHSVADGGTSDQDGWSTLVWARDGATWKAVYWQWATGGADAERERWNKTYADGHGFNPRPSKFLTEMLEGRTPGTALDVAMGQGRNTLLLASRGWHVTGIDISDEGLRIARQAAVDRKLTIEAIVADATTWNYGNEKWDLVAFIYSGCDDKQASMVSAALKHGGLVVIEGFHKDAAPAIGYATGALAARFGKGFTILRDEVVDDVSDWGWGAQNGSRQKLVRFAAQKQ
jgi:SAM-dependent methyltransferase